MILLDKVNKLSLHGDKPDSWKWRNLISYIDKVNTKEYRHARDYFMDSLKFHNVTVKAIRYNAKLNPYPIGGKNLQKFANGHVISETLLNKLLHFLHEEETQRTEPK